MQSAPGPRDKYAAGKPRNENKISAKFMPRHISLAALHIVVTKGDLKYNDMNAPSKNYRSYRTEENRHIDPNGIAHCSLREKLQRPLTRQQGWYLGTRLTDLLHLAAQDHLMNDNHSCYGFSNGGAKLLIIS